MNEREKLIAWLEGIKISCRSWDKAKDKACNFMKKHSFSRAERVKVYERVFNVHSERSEVQDGRI